LLSSQLLRFAGIEQGLIIVLLVYIYARKIAEYHNHSIMTRQMLFQVCQCLMIIGCTLRIISAVYKAATHTDIQGGQGCFKITRLPAPGKGAAVICLPFIIITFYGISVGYICLCNANTVPETCSQTYLFRF